MTTLADKIKRIRMIKGLSQDEMSDRMHMSQKAYSNLENNKTKIDDERLNQIAVVFEMNPYDVRLFDEKLVFDNCSQSSNIHSITNNESFADERKIYETLIATLQSDKLQLKVQCLRLLNLVEKLICK